MSGDIAEEPLARAVPRHLATTRGKDDPLGSFARTVVNGEATLRDAANFPWHSNALAAATLEAQQQQDQLPEEDRSAIEEKARRLQTQGQHDVDPSQRQ